MVDRSVSGSKLKFQPTALVMDDYEAVRTVLSRILERLGYEVHAVADGDAAVSAVVSRAQATPPARERPYDCVFLDAHVKGGRGGLEVVDRLLEACPAARVVLVTGDVEMSDRKALSLGFAAQLPKPFTTASVAAVLRKVGAPCANF
ncbi:MAG: hypothetical protein Kow0069_07660 [Promethearchaeota archaeon]